MEVNPPPKPKQLAKHTMPVIMVAAVGVVLSTFALSYYKAIDLNDGTALSRGLTAQTLHVRPIPRGLIKISFGNQAAAGPNPAGQTVQRLITMQELNPPQ